MSGSKGKATTGGTKRAREAAASAPVIDANSLRFLRQSDGIAESDLQQWESALTESFVLSDQTTYGQVLLLRGLVQIDGFVVSDYIERARKSFTDKGMTPPSALNKTTFSKLGVMLLAVEHGISPEAVSKRDRERWTLVVSTARGNGPGRSGELRRVLRRVDAKRAEIDAALTPVEKVDDGEETVDDGAVVAELDTATPPVEQPDQSPLDAWIEATGALVLSALSADELATVAATAATLVERVAEAQETAAA